jgi:cytochrome c-type biogenesis protein CcmH/NrfG
VTAALELAAMLAMTAVAVAGASWPYRRGRIPAVDPPADPLEDRRTALLLALADLEDARGSGAVDEQDYARLRSETESRMVRVLRALDQRASHPPANGEARSPGSRWTASRYVAIGVVAALALSVALVPALVRSLSNRSPASEAGDVSSIASFEQRVSDHPSDVAARLDLGRRYLDGGRLTDASRQYAAALRLDRNNVEALAGVGLIQHLSGHSRQGLDTARRALQIDPSYPRALFVEGVILLKGLDRPMAAAAALDAYLRAAPFGPEAAQAKELLSQT